MEDLIDGWWCVYETDRRYGGPEEGGWWYDDGVLISCVPASRSRLKAKYGTDCDEQHAGKALLEAVVGTQRWPADKLSLEWRDEQPEPYYPQSKPRYE